MARGDSYQLQGQQGGVYLSAGEISTKKFRVIHALTDTVIDGFNGTNIVSTSTGLPINGLTLKANAVVGGQFDGVSVLSGSVICYYA
jgi:hypothetical protein